MSNTDIALIVLTVLFFKHFICDFIWQTPYMLENKGKYGHPGGLMHATAHGFGTFVSFVSIFLCLGSISLFVLVPSIVLGALDAIIHYHIDWLKVRLSGGLTPNDHSFWVAFGADQLAHALTYIILVSAVIM